jgi:hypothetical protein
MHRSLIIRMRCSKIKHLGLSFGLRSQCACIAGRYGGETKGADCSARCHDGVAGIRRRTGRYLRRDQLYGVKEAVSCKFTVFPVFLLPFCVGSGRVHQSYLCEWYHRGRSFMAAANTCSSSRSATTRRRLSGTIATR